MRYIVTYTENQMQYCFRTAWFDSENNFNADVQMMVIDLATDKYTINGTDWLDIIEDHL